jgi:hypothetical protein
VTGLDDVLDEYIEKRLEFEDEPYWLHLRQPRSGELQYDTFAYFPEAHYTKRIQNEIWGKEDTKDETVPDGGTTNLHTDGRRNTVYYWLNPDTGAALYHTNINGEEADPFFGTIQEAEKYLE